jgi:N-dimethylarginine dimethylaminohydrolase
MRESLSQSPEEFVEKQQCDKYWITIDAEDRTIDKIAEQINGLVEFYKDNHLETVTIEQLKNALFN